MRRRRNNNATTSLGELEDFSRRVEKDISLVSHFSKCTFDKGAWYMDNRASKHMTS